MIHRTDEDPKRNLLEELSREDACLGELDREGEEAEARVAALRQRLAAVGRQLEKRLPRPGQRLASSGSSLISRESHARG